MTPLNASAVRVSYDREIFNVQKYGGVSKSFAELFSRFDLMPEFGIQPRLTFTRTRNYHLSRGEYGLLPGRHFINATGGLSTLLTYGPIRELSSMFAGGGIGRGDLADVFHATYYRPTLIEQRSGSKLAVSIHDFIPERLGWTGLRNPHIGKRALALKADLIIAVSKVTAQEIIEHYKIDEDRIRVVQHGVSIPSPEKEHKQDSEPAYVLYVGHRDGYKNFSVLPAALKILHSQNHDLSLTLCGPSLSSTEIQELDCQLGSTNWKFVETPSEEKLSELYRHAFAHVVTSKMEGFGMTILESMAHGIPTVVSDIPIFHEVAEDSAIYFDASSAESLSRALELLFLNENRSNYKLSSLNRAKFMSWERSAAEMSLAYHSIC